MKLRMQTVKKFFALAPSDQRLVLTAASWVATIRLGLWLLRLQNTQRLLARFAKTRAAINHPPAASPERIAWAVQAASRYVPDAACLVQALAAQTLLARNGYAAEVRIGVALEQGVLQAHAWVESQGKVLIGGGSVLDHLTPLTNFDS